MSSDTLMYGLLSCLITIVTEGGCRLCFFFVSICLSVSKITQKLMQGFGWNCGVCKSSSRSRSPKCQNSQFGQFHLDKALWKNPVRCSMQLNVCSYEMWCWALKYEITHPNHDLTKKHTMICPWLLLMNRPWHLSGPPCGRLFTVCVTVRQF